MKTKAKAWITAAAFLILLCFLPLCASAAETQQDGVRYENPETGYQIMILDELDFLSPSEETKLIEDMMPVTEFGNIIFWSTDEPTFDEIEQASKKRYELYGFESAGIFAINDDARKVTFQSYGKIYEFVNPSLARSITDNVSHYASTGDYYSCAQETFYEVNEVLHGNSIAEPMKYISFIVIALMLSFVIIVGIAFGKIFNPLARADEEQALLVGKGDLVSGEVRVVKTGSQTRTWVIVLIHILLSIGKSGGGGGSSSSGGGGGGGSSGGGGGGSSSY